MRMLRYYSILRGAIKQQWCVCYIAWTGLVVLLLFFSRFFVYYRYFPATRDKQSRGTTFRTMIGFENVATVVSDPGSAISCIYRAGSGAVTNSVATTK